MRPCGNDAARIQRLDRIVAGLDVIRSDTGRERGHLQQSAQVVVHCRVGTQRPKVALEQTIIGQLETHEGDEGAELGPGGPAQELFGQRFHWNEFAVGGIWALHVWLWRHNPAGLFADWNPNVSCQFAEG
jgi:hypothetical protein